MEENQSGQVNILAVVGIVISIALATIAGYAAQNVRTDDKIGKTNEQINAVSERTAVLEEAIKTIKKDTEITRDDIKEILKRVK